MCGRYTLTQRFQKLSQHFESILFNCEYVARYNIAPAQEVPVLRMGPAGTEMLSMQWGLIPSWTRPDKKGTGLINARAETIDEKPSFKSSFKNKRCLIPADGFIEWSVVNGDKVPHYIQTRPADLFCFAGIWSEWEHPGGSLLSCSIITTEANKKLEPLHHRMPVILPAEHYHDWMNPESDPNELKPLLRPSAENLLEYHPISRKINSAANDTPQLLEPLDGPEEPDLPLFSS